ncbi:MAG: hypothetical protein AVDCRST_MAG54-4405, partial [uncultured Actinomycetospora sp.]
ARRRPARHRRRPPRRAPLRRRRAGRHRGADVDRARRLVRGGRAGARPPAQPVRAGGRAALAAARAGGARRGGARGVRRARAAVRDRAPDAGLPRRDRGRPLGPGAVGHRHRLPLQGRDQPVLVGAHARGPVRRPRLDLRPARPGRHPHRRARRVLRRAGGRRRRRRRPAPPAHAPRL